MSQRIRRHLRRARNQMWMSSNWIGFRAGYKAALDDLWEGRVVLGDDAAKAAARGLR